MVPTRYATRSVTGTATTAFKKSALARWYVTEVQLLCLTWCNDTRHDLLLDTVDVFLVVLGMLDLQMLVEGALRSVNN